MSIPDYDYIIAGAGCAGLSLAMHLLGSDLLRSKKILIIDRDNKTENDRTWCFWEKQQSLFEPIVSSHWNYLLFRDGDFEKILSIKPYTYKLIRGIDFYEYCFDKLSAMANITFLLCGIDKIFSDAETGVIANGKKYTAEFVFNSTYRLPPPKRNEYRLLQHFKGWKIKSAEPAFNSKLATLMDFTTNQEKGPTFFYVLPFNETEALIEYTQFSKAVLENSEYEKALKSYIENDLGIVKYDVVEVENGIIPMTNHKFGAGNRNVINIGTAGGLTKGSSGYTFHFIQKHSSAIVEFLNQGKHPINANPSNRRHHFYDSVLLRIISTNSMPGNVIFKDLFNKNSTEKVLEFLHNESNIRNELEIITSLPTLTFMKSAVRQML